MITTTSGLNLESGVNASQYLNDFISTDEQYITAVCQESYSTHNEELVETFAFPSHHIMQRLLGVFSGKTKYLPEKYLFNDKRNNNEANNQSIKDFVNSVLKETVTKETYNELNQLIRKSEQIAIISNNPLVDGHVQIPKNIFIDDLEKREEELSLYIRKTFGAEGLRHFLGLIIGLDENGRNGEYKFTLSEHLTKLGYKRSKKGSFDPALKWKAFRIIDVLSSLHLSLSYRDRGRQKATVIKLFSLDRYDIEQEVESTDIIHMGFIIRANEDWYGQAFQKTDTRSQQYTQLLKKITAENHSQHSLAIYLAVQFAIRWRINQFKPIKLKISTLMEWCELDYSGNNRKRSRDLRKLEAELEYMIKADYLGAWCCSRHPQPSDPFTAVLRLDTPSWLSSSMKIKSQPVQKVQSTITVEGLKWVQKQTSLSQKELAERLGVSRQHINNILHGRSRISSELSEKITEVFSHIFEEVST